VYVTPSQAHIKGYSGAYTSEDSSKNLPVNTWFKNIKEKAKEAGIEVETREVTSGYSAGQVLVDLSEKEKVDLIVVGTRGATGFKKLLLGSTALEVVSYSDCSVTIVK
jgi:nucleotide-binding universal stress UspA family protein